VRAREAGRKKMFKIKLRDIIHIQDKKERNVNESSSAAVARKWIGGISIISVFEGNGRRHTR
jgi:hypothetical protein